MKNNSYNWDAEDYARHSSEQFSWAQGLIRKLRLAGPERILDLGCGDGKITALISGELTSGQVFGIDSAWSMVASAAKNYRTGQQSGPIFLQMDAEELGFQRAFDIVFSNAVLHWIPNHPAVLNGIRRSLVPGGVCLLQMGGAGNAAQMVQTLDRVISGASWRKFFPDFEFPYYFYGIEDYRVLLDKAGLREDRIELIKKDMKHQGPEGLAGWLRTTWLPYVNQVPAQSRETFISEVVDQYLQAYPADALGVVHVPMVRLEVEARRSF